MLDAFTHDLITYPRTSGRVNGPPLLGRLHEPNCESSIRPLVGGKLSGLYDDQGNATRGRSAIVSGAQEAWSMSGAIAVSTPFAAAQALPPEVWKAISILIGAAR
jgi:hypothetical protein